MRVTTLLSQMRREADILRGQERLEHAQSQVSSGVRITKPSDAPGQISELLRVQSEIAAKGALNSSIEAVMPIAKTTDSALADITNNLRQLRSVANQAINGATNADQRAVLAGQVGQIIEAIRFATNTSLGGKYIFAGTASDQAPFQPGPPVTYNGNSNPLTITLTGGQPFAYAISGTQIVNARGSTDLFSNLSSLQTAISTGDTAGMQTAALEVDHDSSNIVRLRADMGSRINYLDHTSTQLADGIIAAQQRESDLKNVDMAEAILDEKTAETTQQATLAIAANIGNPSLLDYLR